MNCQQINDILLDSVYDELAASDQAALDSHLSDCASCRRQHHDLHAACLLLDQLPSRPVNLSPARIRSASVQRQQRTRRPWQNAALFAAVAASVIIVVAAASQTRLELQADRLTIAWDRSKPVMPDQALTAVPAPTKSAAPDPKPPALVITPQEWQRLIDTVRLLANEQSATDCRHAAAIVALQDQLEQFRRRDAEQIRLIARDVQALYLAQYQPNPKAKGVSQ